MFSDVIPTACPFFVVTRIIYSVDRLTPLKIVFTHIIFANCAIVHPRPVGRATKEQAEHSSSEWRTHFLWFSLTTTLNYKLNTKLDSSLVVRKAVCMCLDPFWALKDHPQPSWCPWKCCSWYFMNHWHHGLLQVSTHCAIVYWALLLSRHLATLHAGPHSVRPMFFPLLVSWYSWNSISSNSEMLSAGLRLS